MVWMKDRTGCLLSWEGDIENKGFTFLGDGYQNSGLEGARVTVSSLTLKLPNSMSWTVTLFPPLKKVYCPQYKQKIY